MEVRRLGSGMMWKDDAPDEEPAILAAPRLFSAGVVFKLLPLYPSNAVNKIVAELALWLLAEVGVS